MLKLLNRIKFYENDYVKEQFLVLICIGTHNFSFLNI